MKKKVIVLVCFLLLAVISVNLIGCDLKSDKKEGKNDKISEESGTQGGGDDQDPNQKPINPSVDAEAAEVFKQFLDGARFFDGISQGIFISQMSAYTYEGVSITDIVEGCHYDGPYGGGYQAGGELFGFSNNYTASEDGTFANYKNAFYTNVALGGLTLPSGIEFGDSLKTALEKLNIHLDIKTSFVPDADDKTSMTLFSGNGVSLKLTNCLLGDTSGKPLYDYELTYTEIYPLANTDAKPTTVTRCVKLSFTDEDMLGKVMLSVNEKRLLKDDLDADNVAVSDFALRLFKAAMENGENTLISPLSVLCALSMTANGAAGATREQMEAVLGMSAEDYNAYLLAYVSSLPQGEKYKLSLANSIYFKEGLTVNENFLKTNKDYYGADIYEAKFDDSTLTDINNWVEKKTDGMIDKLLDNIPAEAVMYLINALAFDAEWATKYHDYDVRNGIFTKEDGTELDVEMMYGEDGYYIEDENASGFIKFYSGCKYAFVALLPNEGISVSEYLASLDGESLQTMLNNPINDVWLYTAMPKFTVEYDIDLAETLQGMGMVDAFVEGEADFSGIGQYHGVDLFINRVIHKTFIEVGEQGTRAGAVTAVEMFPEGAMPGEIKRVYLNRPFVYMLIDCENNIPFFIGTLMEIE